MDGSLTNRGSRWRAVFAALVLFLASTVTMIVAAQPAHAICDNGNPENFYGPHANGQFRGLLAPRSGACNGDGEYGGYLYDLVADGVGVFLYLCDDRDGPCKEFYVGGAGNRVPVDRADGDGEQIARLRWGSGSDERWIRGY